MIHPSYFELMDIVNKDVKEGEEPIVKSRYSIVLGTSKRARQLIAADIHSRNGIEEKPLSIAVDELNNGDIRIISEEEADMLRAKREAEAAARAALEAARLAAEAESLDEETAEETEDAAEADVFAEAEETAAAEVDSADEQ